MATFGDSTDYTSSSTSSAASKIANAQTAGASGTLQSLTALLSVTTTAVCRGIIYTNNAGIPSTVLAVSDSQTISGSTKQSITFNFSGANQIQIANGTTYQIGVYWEAPSSSGTISWYRGSTSAAANKSSDTATGPANTWASNSTISGPLGVYCTFDTTTPTITASHTKKIGSVAGNSTSAITVAGPTSGSDTIIAAVTWYTGSGAYPTCAITDSQSNSYSTLYSYTGSSTTGPSMLVAIATNTTALTSGNTITATFTGTAPFSVMIADEWNNVVTSTLDGSNVADHVTSATTAISTSSLTTTNATDLVLCYVGSFGNLTATSWYGAWNTNAEFQSSAPTLSESWALSADTTTFSATATLSAAEIWDSVLIALKAPASGGAVVQPSLMMMGMGT